MEAKQNENCVCPKTTCDNHGVCSKCIAKHKAADGVPHCIFPAKDKSLNNFYHELKKRFD